MLRRKNASLQGGACLSFAPRLLPIGRGDSVIPARGDVARNADPRKASAEKVRRDAARHVSCHLECAGHIREFDEKL